ncbi:hypothetical protein EVG80_15465 [Salmonella enterica subsp. enterica serovar Mississippi]|nr:hypothetical protein [Salmonella enterica subsp. enterica serovar Mississippi]
MIKMCMPEPSGNAVRLYLQPPSDAVEWRILRDTDPNLTTPHPVYTGTDDVLVDTLALENNVLVHYRAEYRLKDGSLSFSNVSYATPRATYEDYTTDTLELLRDRLEAGLMEEVNRGVLVSDLGYVQVLTAPPSLQNNLAFPLVTLLLENESPAERSIGDLIDDDFYDEDSKEWGDQAGWMADVSISITGWSLNPTERIELRKALRRVLIANFNVFALRGVLLPSFSLTDTDAVSGEFDAPLYLVNGDFKCQAPIRVGLKSAQSITEVIAEVNNP